MDKLSNYILAFIFCAVNIFLAKRSKIFCGRGNGGNQSVTPIRCPLLVSRPYTAYHEIIYMSIFSCNFV
nr:MAG TPA: hypothetical protein [Caudoviricetes sp.]